MTNLKGLGYDSFYEYYRLGTVNSKAFVGKDFLQNKWKYGLTVYFKHEMIGTRNFELSGTSN